MPRPFQPDVKTEGNRLLKLPDSAGVIVLPVSGLPEPMAVDLAEKLADALRHVRSLPGGDQIPPRPLCAVNLSHAPLETRLTEGDEVALLPPLAGG